MVTASPRLSDAAVGISAAAATDSTEMLRDLGVTAVAGARDRRAAGPARRVHPGRRAALRP